MDNKASFIYRNCVVTKKPYEEISDRYFKYDIVSLAFKANRVFSIDDLGHHKNRIKAYIDQRLEQLISHDYDNECECEACTSQTCGDCTEHIDDCICGADSDFNEDNIPDNEDNDVF